MYLLSKLNAIDIFLLNFDGKLLKEASNIHAIAQLFCCLNISIVTLTSLPALYSNSSPPCNNGYFQPRFLWNPISIWNLITQPVSTLAPISTFDHLSSCRYTEQVPTFYECALVQSSNLSRFLPITNSQSTQSQVKSLILSINVSLV